MAGKRVNGHDLKETIAWFSEHRQEWLSGTAYRFAVLRDDRMIGLMDIDAVAGGEGDLGDWFERASWGRSLPRRRHAPWWPLPSATWG